MKILLSLFVMFWPIALLAAEPKVEFTDDEIAMIGAHGPWPHGQVADPSNGYSGDDAAIQFGKKLFFFKGLSKNNNQSCATCHQPDKNFTDGLARGVGRAMVDRNSIALLNLRWNRWHGWGGKSDTLWGQSIHPIIDKNELGLTSKLLVERLSKHQDLSSSYKRTYGDIPSNDDPELVLVHVGKALAAWQETIRTGPSPFDEFRRRMVDDTNGRALNYPLAAQRGLKLFVGNAKCSFCHFGPNFTDGEFHNIGLPFFVEDGRVDSGRYGGIQTYRKNPYRRNGRYSDEPKAKATKSPGEYVKLQHRNWGEFRTPSLRNVAQTAPYMHDGSLSSLTDVVRHYSELNMERLHVNGESLLRPLSLSEAEITDLVAFLKTLSGPIYHR